MTHTASPERYETMTYSRCGRSGIKLPKIALGLWQNFGGMEVFDHSRAMLLRAFDLGITHFDIANNYGPPPGSAEECFGRVLKSDLGRYRDELIISSKAGFLMWEGPYGEWGSRKNLLASCDQSLKRVGVDYFDIFYHHRPDLDTPLEESMGALDTIVRSGRALYAGISNYSPERTREAVAILRDLGTPCLIHQINYSMFNRGLEDGLIDVLDENGVGCIAFCPLAGGRLTDRYLDGIPSDSRAGKAHGTFTEAHITEEFVEKAGRLNALAQARGQSLAQVALSWTLRDPRVTSALIGASRIEHIEANVAALNNLEFTASELAEIDGILADGQT
jgi:L-glyceraldehyde 3-phosphate reductase